MSRAQWGHGYFAGMKAAKLNNTTTEIRNNIYALYSKEDSEYNKTLSESIKYIARELAELEPFDNKYKELLGEADTIRTIKSWLFKKYAALSPYKVLF